MTQTYVDRFREAIEDLDKVKADRILNDALGSLTPIQAVERIICPVLKDIGQAWHEGRVALSQVYMSGRYCEALIDRVLPPADPDRKSQPRTAIVVLNDYHMLGKRIVYSVMRASGFELLDYGRMDVAEVVRRVKADDVRVLLVSVLMLPSALMVRDLRRCLGPEVKIAVGGAPFLFDSELWREVGADAMGNSAADVVDIVGRWTERMP